jgi:hypothetical protein
MRTRPFCYLAINNNYILEIINMRKLMNKTAISTAVSTVLMAVSLSASPVATAGTVLFADPVPAGPTYPGCLEDLGGTPTGADGGISYDWTVTMGKHDNATLINFAGAKSLSEIPPFYVAPDVGWTHTSNWVALEVTKKTKLHVKVSRIEGVPFVVLDAENKLFAKGLARDSLIPGVAIYHGWDNTSCEDHRFNPSGNVAWSTLTWIGNNLNTAQKGTVEYKINLMPGKYSMAVGGAPKTLATYPADNCDPTNKTCYTYTGRHGYRMEMKTGD